MWQNWPYLAAQGQSTRMNGNASKTTSSRSVPTHQEASSSLFDRGLVTITFTAIEDIFERLNLKKFNSIEEASEEASTCQCLLEKLKNITSERRLQESLAAFLFTIISSKYHIVERERKNEDNSRCDIIISRGTCNKNESKAVGRPAVLIELKRPLKKRLLSLSEHQDQVVRYAKELLSKHVSVASLPLVLFNGREFYLGLAEWPSYNRLEIKFDKTMFSLFDTYIQIATLNFLLTSFCSKQQPDVCNIANLLQILKCTGRLRPRRIQTDSKTMYKLNRVIGYGATSVVYQAEMVPISDAGKAVQNTYPYTLTTAQTIQKDEVDPDSDSDVEEWNSEENLTEEEENYCSESDTENTEMDVDTLNSLASILSTSHSLSYRSSSPSPLGQEPVLGSKDHAAALDPITDQIEATEVRAGSLILKFSSHRRCLEREVYVDSRLPPKYKVGWQTQLYALNDGGKQFCQYNSYVYTPMKSHKDFMIIGELHRPLIKAVFGIPYKTTLALTRDDLLPLLENLFAIHDAGVVHRDIRPANILRKSDQFVIADFGFAVDSGSEEIYSGTRETASQRILSLLFMNEPVKAHNAYKNRRMKALQEDDLESFLKLIKITFEQLNLPPVDRNTIKYYQDLYCFWIVDHDVRHFLGLRDIESKREFLRNMCMQNVDLEKAKRCHAESLPKITQQV